MDITKLSMEALGYQAYLAIVRAENEAKNRQVLEQQMGILKIKESVKKEVEEV